MEEKPGVSFVGECSLSNTQKRAHKIALTRCTLLVVVTRTLTDGKSVPSLKRRFVDPSMTTTPSSALPTIGRDCPPQSWYVADTKRYGRGLFASRNILKGTIIDVCPYVVDRRNELRGRFLDFVWDEDEFSVLVLGCGSLFNHNDAPNVSWFYRHEKFEHDDPISQVRT